MGATFVVVLFVFVANALACLPGTGFGYPGYSYPNYAYSYGGFSPYSTKSRHAASDTKTQFAANSDAKAEGCVTKMDNAHLTCAKTFESRPLSTAEDCQRRCFDAILKCQSFEFNTLTMTCDLYTVPPPQGIMDSARAPNPPFADDPLEEFKERRRSLRARRQMDVFQDPLNLPQFPDYCEPQVVQRLGVTLYVPNVDCAPAAQFQSSFENTLEPFNGHGVPEHSRASNSLSPVSPSEASVRVIPEMPDCRDGGRARIQLIEGIQFAIDKKPVAKIRLDSPDQCLLLCRNNAYMDGTRFAKPCMAATFDRTNGLCTVMDEAITPNGNLAYLPDKDAVYFEKMCIPVNELGENCDDVVHRMPQRVMSQHADATIDTRNQVDCVRSCITASRLLGFTCRSATYYFDSPSQNCILNRFTRLEHPEAFAAERFRKVDYMELAPCMLKAWQQRDQAAVWSEWSSCDHLNTKSRQRNCSNCEQRSETVACDAESGRSRAAAETAMELRSDAVSVPKKLAANFDAARQLKGATEPEEEQSLFGEQDYDHQGEMSFFGPPHGPEPSAPRNELLDADNVIDITKSVGAKEAIQIQPLPAPPQARSVPVGGNGVQDNMGGRGRGTGDGLKLHEEPVHAEVYVSPVAPRITETRELGEGVGVVEFSTEKKEPNWQGLRKMPEDSSIGHKPVQLSPRDLSESPACEPTKECCPLVDMTGRKTRGCTLGFRINERRQQEGCVPEACRHRTSGGGTFRRFFVF